MSALRRLVSAGLVLLCVLVGGLVLGGVPALAVTRHVLSASFGSFAGPVGGGEDRVSGNVYVADAEGFVVDRFGEAGETLAPSRLKGQSFEEPYGLAVDNSGGLTQGDVYVADYAGGVLDKFDGSGEYLSQITGLTHPAGVAVDGEGNVYVSELESGQVDKFNVSGEPDPGNPIITGLSSPVALAVNGEGHIFAATGNGTLEFDAAGVCVQSECAALDAAGTSGVATDVEGNVYTDEGTSVAEYDPAGSLVERFGEGSLSGAYGLAVDGAKVYVVDYAARTAHVFTEVVLPDPVTGEASSIASSGAALHGTVNPDGAEATCSFEYGVEETYGQSAPCSEGAGSGSSPVPVTAELAGLEPNRTYHYRLVASNANGSNPGQDQTFTTLAIPPAIAETSVSNVAETSATLDAQVNPNGSDTTYYFQYGSTTSYGTSIPAPPGTDLGSGREAQPVSVHIQGLQPSTVYHYRVIAVDSAGTSEGPDRTFLTQSHGGPFALPDNRAFELVSPADKNGNDAQPDGDPSYILYNQSSVSGDSIAYQSLVPVASGQASLLGNDFLASRTGTGWSTQPRDLPRFNATTDFGGEGEFRASSPDLSKSVVVAVNSPAVSGAPQNQPNVYLHDNVTGAYQLLTNTASTDGFNGVVVTGTSADFTHVVFGSEEALTPEAAALPGNRHKLYEGTGSQLRMVSVFPDGQPTGGFLGSPGGYASHAVSADGSRIFWSEETSERLYVRENGVSTVQISNGEGRFEGASSDGSKVLYIEAGELYEYDFGTGQRTALAPAGTKLNSGVLGASDDLSYVYLMGEGLNVLHDNGGSWTTTFIATLSNYGSGANDRADWGSASGNGDIGLLERTSEVSSDGRNVVFMSVNSLTGYENAGKREVYLYNAPSGVLTCVSCNPDGGSPAGPSSVPPGHNRVYQTRYLADGRVFFNSLDALVPGDGNGLQDVYEWERDGLGSCRIVGGCVYLLSGARSGIEAAFGDASASGDDVFFRTRAQLVAGDHDQNVDIYDARVGGGFPESVPAPPCEGAGCRTSAGSPPVFSSPLSASFAGAGNTTPSASVPTVKAKPKLKAKHKAKAKKKTKKKRKKKRGKRAKGVRKAALPAVGRGVSGARARRSS